MSDNLRHRIAYALAQADGDEPGMEPASCDYEMADAVISDLNLEVGDNYRVSAGTGVYVIGYYETTEDVAADE